MRTPSLPGGIGEPRCGEPWSRGVSSQDQTAQPLAIQGFPGGTRIKNLLANAGDVRDAGSILGLRRFPGGGHGNPLQVFLPGESHGQRSLVGYSPWGRKVSDTTERPSTSGSIMCRPAHRLEGRQRQDWEAGHPGALGLASAQLPQLPSFPDLLQGDRAVGSNQCLAVRAMTAFLGFWTCIKPCSIRSSSGLVVRRHVRNLSLQGPTTAEC